MRRIGQSKPDSLDVSAQNNKEVENKSLTKKQVVEQALFEAKEFSKDIRRYLFDVSQERLLTEREQKLYDTTHYIHVHTNDALLLLDELISKNL